MELPGFMTPHTVTVEPYLGQGAAGPVFGPPVSSRAYVEDARALVRMADGKNVTSTGLVVLPLSAFDQLQPESRVTVHGVQRTALTVARRHFSGATPNHWEVLLR